MSSVHWVPWYHISEAVLSIICGIAVIVCETSFIVITNSSLFVSFVCGILSIITGIMLIVNILKKKDYTKISLALDSVVCISIVSSLISGLFYNCTKGTLYLCTIRKIFLWIDLFVTLIHIICVSMEEKRRRQLSNSQLNIQTNPAESSVDYGVNFDSSHITDSRPPEYTECQPPPYYIIVEEIPPPPPPYRIT